MDQEPQCTVATIAGCHWCDKLKAKFGNTNHCAFVDCEKDASHAACKIADKQGGFPTTVCTYGTETKTLGGFSNDWLKLSMDLKNEMRNAHTTDLAYANTANLLKTFGN